jgi:hypothetical protein
LLTTPSFDFNTRFRAPGDEDWGYADPTGRTTRTFRHLDHKFEWTVDECDEWCSAAALEWGYEVSIDGLGRSITKDPWGRDSDGVRASQAVTFRRLEGGEWAAKRAAKYAAWASGRKDVPTQPPHTLLSTHRYEPHASAQKLAPRTDIVAAVKAVIQDIGSPQATIFELWREDSVSTVCSGWLEILVDVLNQDDTFIIHKEGESVDDWKVECPGLELRGRNPWQSTAKLDDAWGESSETTDNTTETYEDGDGSVRDYDEEYDGRSWDETEDAGWAVSDSEGWSQDKADVDSLKGWEEWQPEPEWIVESSTWD